jgi:hypothetical protein
VGYYRRGFFHCGIQRKSFFHCGIQQRFSSVVDTTEVVFSIEGYNGEQFQDGWQIFFRCIPRRCFSSILFYTTTESYAVLYPTTQKLFLHSISHLTPKNNIFYIINTTHKRIVGCNTENLPHCIPQCCRFSSVVSHNERDFPLLWDTMEEVFFCCGIQWRTKIQHRMIFFTF